METKGSGDKEGIPADEETDQSRQEVGECGHRGNVGQWLVTAVQYQPCKRVQLGSSWEVK